MTKKKKAMKYYEGKYNCAQSIMKAFGDSDELVEECRKHGGGRAKDGMCGALHAGLILTEDDPDKQEALTAYFVKKATSTKCKEVRKAKILTCGKCVERVAKFLEKDQGE